MTREEAKALKRYDHMCTCGGYAWHLNGRDPRDPHMGWCPQKPQYDERRAALEGEE